MNGREELQIHLLIQLILFIANQHYTMAKRRIGVNMGDFQMFMLAFGSEMIYCIYPRAQSECVWVRALAMTILDGHV